MNSNKPSPTTWPTNIQHSSSKPERFQWCCRACFTGKYREENCLLPKKKMVWFKQEICLLVRHSVSQFCHQIERQIHALL